jgi:hypothetical protein
MFFCVLFYRSPLYIPQVKATKQSKIVQTLIPQVRASNPITNNAPTLIADHAEAPVVGHSHNATVSYFDPML